MNIAVIFAGGVGKRMNSKVKPKQFLTMHDIPIIVHTIRHFQKNKNIDSIVVACLDSWMDYTLKLVHDYQLDKVKKVVKGGETGQLSIYHGLVAAEELSKGDKSIVLIHDGVRPLINSTLIDRNIESVIKYGSAITSVEVKETIMEVSSDGTILHIPERKNSRLARAPQSFWLDEVLDVHKKALDEGKQNFIDSCSMMQFYGKKLHLVDGPEENIKITTPEDFYIMRAILDAKENSQIYGYEEE